MMRLTEPLLAIRISDGPDLQEEEEDQIINSKLDLIRKTSQIQDNSVHLTELKKNEMSEQLFQLGIDMDVARFALRKTAYQSLERAIQYLQDKNFEGKYEHEFQPLDKEQSICMICFDSKINHQDDQFETILSQRAQSLVNGFDPDTESGGMTKMKRAQTIYDQQKLFEQFDDSEYLRSIRQNSIVVKKLSQNDKHAENFTCDICYNVVSREKIVKLDCDHAFCADCLNESFKYYILRGEVDKVVCAAPQCGEKPTREQLLKIFSGDQETLIKYDRFFQKKKLDKDPLVRYCPKVGCEGWVRAPNFNSKKVRCQECNTAICFRCRDEWHGYCVSCNRNAQSKFDDWAKTIENISYCPKCRTRIEKVEGCNHMTCYICTFQWCWICGATYTSDHFNPGNIFGCPGQQYSEKPSCCKRYMIMLGYILLALICLPFVLVLGGPVFCCFGCFNLSHRIFLSEYPLSKKGIFILCFLALIGFALGFILSAIVIPLFFLVFIPYLIGYFAWKKIKVHRQADETLRRIMEGQEHLYHH